MTWESPWRERWRRYARCRYCDAPAGEPCRDQRWDGKHDRWCRHPHPERERA